MEPLLSADRSRCTACGACTAVCPHRIPIPGPDGVPATEAWAPEACILCGHCVAVCPVEALRHRDLPQGEFPEGSDSPPAAEALAWLRRRRSVRAYLARQVPEDIVEALLEAARYAPAGHNARDVMCVAVCSESRRGELRDATIAFYRRVFRLARHRMGRALLSCLVGRDRVSELRDALPGMVRAESRLVRGEDPLFHHAPAILLFHAPVSETAEADCAVAAAHVALLAPSFGLGTCYIGYASAALKRSRPVAARFGVSPRRRVFAVLTLGYASVAYRRMIPRPRLPVRFL